MGNSYIDISVHIIFHTKNTGCIIREEDLPHVFRYIGGIIKNNAGIALQIGGRPDHIHILAMLPGTISICDFVRIIKTNTSKWIKGLDSSYRFFSWQEGFGAFSVSEPNREAVINYIINQKEHHKKRTGQEEFALFVAKMAHKIARKGEIA